VKEVKRYKLSIVFAIDQTSFLALYMTFFFLAISSKLFCSNLAAVAVRHESTRATVIVSVSLSFSQTTAIQVHKYK